MTILWLTTDRVRTIAQLSLVNDTTGEQTDKILLSSQIDEWTKKADWILWAEKRGSK